MNSYPPELVAQLAPVMFVAGLGGPPQPTTPVSPAPKPQDPFVTLSTRLKEALLAQRKSGIWQPIKSKTFQVVLVDPDVRFPPRKMPPAEDHQFLPTHSPLSPLTPSSPLHPDGLIAPIWIRKHTTLVPSVFVLFKRLFEYPRPGNVSPLDATDLQHDKDREAEERRRDTELSAEISQRKKTTNERSIKLTVVLMASRRMLDDPALDTRLTYIRRQSGLDPRAALFVLSPVTQAEIGDFVQSLQLALYEPALEYYTNHSKRVRRKRNRHSQANNTYPTPISPVGPPIARPLRPEGWTVRYEYKMACFAEFRGEDEVALKHYQDAYANLLIMFGSTAILPPRTKRWAEAKVLADCISLKVCKLYLYNNEHSLALAHHNMHMRKFADLSRGWGIGEETFEFWSWLTRQHRVFAELLEQGTRSTLIIPNYTPASYSAASTVVAQPLDSQKSAVEMESLRTLGLNPTQALQHPGFYYFMAARCTESRRARFLAALEHESSDSPIINSPGFANENKVDHLTIILELYTRAYELFKKYSPTANQGRQTLWIAYRIARTYHDSGKFDMAVKFFERIAKTYRREKWDAMLLPLLTTWYACAQQLGDLELSIQLLFEMIAHGTSIDDEDPDSVQEDLLAVFRSTVPTHPDTPLVVDLSEAEPLLNYSVLFWAPEVKIGEKAVYQVTLAAPANVHISSLPFTSLSIYFKEESSPLVIYHVDGEPIDRMVQRITLGHVDHTSYAEKISTYEGYLRWLPGSKIVVTGTLSSMVPTTMSITKVVLAIKEGSWSVELPIASPSSRGGWATLPQWLASVKPPKFVPLRRDSEVYTSSVSVRLRPHLINVSLSHTAPAYVGEEYPIIIEVTNTDSRELDIVADALLQPSEMEGSVTSISDDKETWSNLIKGVSFGKLSPGMSAVRTLYLSITSGAGDRVIDLSIQSINLCYKPSIDTLQSPKSPSLSDTDVGETLKTLTVSVVDPISVETSVQYRRTPASQPALANLSTYDEDYWDESTGGRAVIATTWTCNGPHGVRVEGVALLREDGASAKVIQSLLDIDNTGLVTDWLPGDQFSDEVMVSLAPDEDTLDVPIVGPGAYEIIWRRLLPNNELGPITKTRFPLPELQPPRDALIALLDAPTTAKLHVPMQIRLVIRNRRPTRSANIIVQVDFDASDGFVLAGLRSGRIPILLPGGEEILIWNAVPVECGYARLPRIRITDRRAVTGQSSQGGAAPEANPEIDSEPVTVVDMRKDERVSGSESLQTIAANAVKKATASVDISVLVLP